MIKLTDYDYKIKQLKDLRHACLVNCIKASSAEIVMDLLKKKLIVETTKISKDKNTDTTNSKNIKNDMNFIKKHFLRKLTVQKKKVTNPKKPTTTKKPTNARTKKIDKTNNAKKTPSPPIKRNQILNDSSSDDTTT